MQAAEDTPPLGEMAEQSKQTMKRLESLISESLQLYEIPLVILVLEYGLLMIVMLRDLHLSYQAKHHSHY